MLPKLSMCVHWCEGKGWFSLTCPSSMSPLWMPGGLSSVLLVRLIDKLWALRFCLGWRAAEADPLLLPPSTGIPPTCWVALPPAHVLSEKQVNNGQTRWLAGGWVRSVGVHNLPAGKKEVKLSFAVIYGTTQGERYLSPQRREQIAT